MSASSTNTPPAGFLWTLVITVLVVLLMVLFGQPGFYLTPFREAQTAITAEYLAKGGPFFAYHTPVLGAPWSWPMEFPLFQGLAALITMAGIPLDAAGRLLSFLSLIGCALVAPRLLAELIGEKVHRGWVGLLVIASPLLLIYGTGFLIESMALLAALAYAWLALAGLRRAINPSETLLRSQVMLTVLGSIACGIAAATIKPTTWAPSAVLVGLVAAVWLFTAQKAWSGRIRHLVLAGLILFIPLFVGLLWVRYSDEVKKLHPLASSMVSGQMANWNYGTLPQKLSPIVWGTILLRGWILALGPLGLLIPIYCGWGLWQARREAPRLIAALALLAAYFAGPLVFTNLYFRHDYYSYANLAYLLMALVVLGIAQDLRKYPRFLGGALAASMALTTLGYLALKQRFKDPELDQVISVIKTSDEPGVIGFLGFDYSAAIPYATQRRALMVGMQEPDQRLAAAVAANANEHFAAIVALSEDYDPAAQVMRKGLGLADAKVILLPSGIKIWTRDALTLGVSATASDLGNYVRERARSPAASSGVVWLRLPFSSKPGNGFELVYRRGNQAVILRSSDFSLSRLRNVWSEPAKPAPE